MFNKLYNKYFTEMCALCREPIPIASFCKSRCGHLYHVNCISEFFDKNRTRLQQRCALCRRKTDTTAITVIWNVDTICYDWCTFATKMKTRNRANDPTEVIICEKCGKKYHLWCYFSHPMAFKSTHCRMCTSSAAAG